MGRLERFEKIRTKQEKEYLGSEWGVGEDDVDFLIEEVERLRNTLKFYAKEETYEQHHHYYGNGNVEKSFHLEYEPFNEMKLDDIVKAVYVGYEVEPKFKVDDWVVIKGDAKFLRSKKSIGKVLEIERNLLYVEGGYGAFTQDFVRHATKEEIFWAELGREVGEFVEGDVVVFDDDSSCRIEPMYPHTIISIKGKHKKNEVKGFYPAASFIKLP